MGGRVICVVGLALALTLRPSLAHAQLETFARAVFGLTEAAALAEPARSRGFRAAADRMVAALVEWDRNIGSLEARVERESAGASDQRAYRLRLELGVAYRARGRIADALREFDAAVALQPASSDLQLLRALTLEATGRSEEAGKAFRAAWDLDARNPVKAYYVIQRPGTASAADRDRARAVLVEAYRRLMSEAARPIAAPFLVLDVIPDDLSRTPVIADDATANAFALLNAGKYAEGAAALRQAAQKSEALTEGSPAAHFARGQRAEAQNRVAEARREYQAALSGTLVARSVLYVAIARLAQVEGDVTAAVDVLARAIPLTPNDPNIHKELASAYATQGRADEAFCELMAALLIDARDAHAHAAVGQLYLDTGREREAVTAFNRALELTPDRYEVRYSLATALTRLGETIEAARQLELFERVRRERLEQRRRGIADEVEREEAIRRGVANQGEAR
jgi:tetratricopeptide (TPR) repeat protein